MARTSDARERLLEAALDLIWASSYGSVSVDDICDRAGVRKGSFYHFFESKAHLALEAYETHWAEIRPQLDRIFSPQVPPLDRLQQLFEALYQDQKRMFQEHGRVCGCPFANLAAELSTQDERLRAKSQDMMERLVRYLESAISDAQRTRLIPGTSARAAAEEIYSLTLGQMLQAKVHNDPEMLRDLGARVLRWLRPRAAA
jgi:TetR/AcrR family transcriptional repressor of nem operon